MKLTKQKKAQGMQTFLRVATSMIAFALIIGFTGNAYAKIKDPARDDSCRSALVVQETIANQIDKKIEQLKGGGASNLAGGSKMWPKQCKYREVELKEDAPAEVGEKVINLMDRCWYMMGQNRKNPLRPFAHTLYFEQASCFVCFGFSAENLDRNIEPSMMMQFLKNKKIADGSSYLDYFNKQLETPEEKAEIIQTPITPAEHFAVVFRDISEREYEEGWQYIGKGKLEIKRLEDARECPSASLVGFGSESEA
jgi:hypothetical protein